jgi:hypothetical protein
MRRYLFLALFCTICSAAAFGQSNEFMDRVSGSSGIVYGDAAYLVLVATDNIAEDAGMAGSFDLAKEMKWVKPSVAPETVISLERYSFLLMRSFGMKGGLMYRIAPCPRYAFRELVSLGVIQGNYDPADKVDGALAVRMLGRIFEIVE